MHSFLNSVYLVALHKRNTTSVDNGTYSFIICFILNVDSNDFRYNAVIFCRSYLIMSPTFNSQSEARDYALHNIDCLKLKIFDSFQKKNLCVSFKFMMLFLSQFLLAFSIACDRFLHKVSPLN